MIQRLGCAGASAGRPAQGITSGNCRLLCPTWLATAQSRAVTPTGS